MLKNSSNKSLFILLKLYYPEQYQKNFLLYWLILLKVIAKKVI